MFDLEKAIAAWRQFQRNNRAFVGDDLDELESHVRHQVAGLQAEGLSEKAAYRQTMGEMGDYGTAEAEYRKVYWGKLRHRRELYHELGWRLSMLKNYLKIAGRNLRKQKGFAFINIFSLSVGMVCCLLILLFVQFERSYDNFHEHSARVYRIPMQKKTASREVAWAVNTAPLAPALKEHFSQVEAAGRLAYQNSVLVQYGDQTSIENNVAWGDQAIFDILTIAFLYGNSSTALSRPHTAVITRATAARFFGSTPSIGKSLIIDGEEYEITGIIENVPEHSHLTFNIIASLLFQEEPWWMTHWPTATCYTYVKLATGVDVANFERQLSTIGDTFSDQYRQRSEHVTFSLQPLEDIHLRSHLDGELKPPGNPVRLWTFSIIGLLILLISCINFVNLTSAKYVNRSKEVGIRKVVGAHRRQVFGQLVGESVMMALIALVLALVVVMLLLPAYRGLVGSPLSLASLFDVVVLPSILGATVIVGAVAGIYPAFLLSSQHPAMAINGFRTSTGGGSSFRKTLVICQFAISIALIIGSITIYQQVDFMKNQDPGFEKQQKLILEFPLTDSFTSRYEVAKAQFIQHPQITATTASSTVPGLTFNTSKIFPTGQENEKGLSSNFIRVDHDFLQEYNIKMVAGRRFMRGMETDRAFGAIIINESMVKALGWATPEEALQHTFYDPPRPIIGVVKDFHIQGFQHAIEPLYMNIWPDRFRYLTLTVRSDNLAETLSFVKQTHANLFPDLPYNAFFLDTAFANQYHFEEQFNRIIGLFSLLGIFIACLGMFGLAAYLLESRTKEVGIRKTLGASLPNLMLLLTKAFMRWVLFGTVLAWPLAYVALSRWLDSFAYHIPLEWPPFVVAAVLSLAIALLTVSYHVIKTATRNPVKALRYE